jgi:hypothetical protein
MRALFAGVVMVLLLIGIMNLMQPQVRSPELAEACCVYKMLRQAGALTGD